MNVSDVVEEVTRQLGDDALEVVATEHEAWVRVAVAAWARTADVARANGLSYFSFLSAMDWQPNPNLDGEKVFAAGAEKQPMGDVIVDPNIRRAGGSSRFQVLMHLYDVHKHVGVTFTADLHDDAPSAPSVAATFRGADWHEREIWEMFGIDFPGHPNLRNMYLPAEFEGHPMRKDFPLLARVVRPWPGLVDMEEMPKPEADDPAAEGAEA